jgi:uncharacterized membrane protein YccC
VTLSAVVGWLREHDPGYVALRRAVRAAVVMPAAFAVGDTVIGNPTVATFAAFGSFAMLVLVDFAGPIRARLEALAALALTGAVLVCLGTLTSRSTWLAAAAMTVVGFGVLFAGVVSSVLASATTSLLLAFILPVSLPGPVSSIPDRLAGWGIAAGAALFATAFLWPAPAREPLRGATVAACRALAERLRSARAGPGRDAAVARSNAAIAALHDVFFATPYRPTGLSTGARALIRLVDELRWLNDIHVQAPQRPEGSGARGRVQAVKSAAARVLECGADQIEAPGGSPEALHAAQAELDDALLALERAATLTVPAGEVISALDPGFRAREMSFIVSQIGANIDFAAAAERRSWMERLLGRRPAGVPTTRAAAQERAGSHAEKHSVWLRNSIRGAAGLGLAVLVAKITGVQHAFWVVLGALSVLRSNALSTGESVLRGLLGTVAGFVVGAVLVAAIGTDTTVLWVLLPPAVLLAALAPATISFAAGQAAFTVTLLILFNILQPQGWEVGLVRIEDVALGSGVSLVVGLLFWPRGAASALGQALSEAYADSARYLGRAVEFGMSRCDESTPPGSAPVDEAIRAAAASRRLDDTFRGYLAEHGAKPVPLAEVTTLVTGVVGLRLAGDAVLDLWQRQGASYGDRTGARRELLTSAVLMTGWYSGFAASLAGRSEVPEPVAPDPSADSRLVRAVSDDLRGDDGKATATGVRMIWTGDHLDAVRRLQGSLVGPARAVAGAERGA